MTTNDNRLRLCSVDDYSQTMKYKGGLHTKNRNSHTRASFSDNGKHIICGSEQGSIVIWDKDIFHASPTSCLPFVPTRKGKANQPFNRNSSGTRSRTKATQKNHAYEMITMREERRSPAGNNNSNHNSNNNNIDNNSSSATYVNPSLAAATVASTATAVPPSTTTPTTTATTQPRATGKSKSTLTLRSTGRAIVAALRGKGLGQGLGKGLGQGLGKGLKQGQPENRGGSDSSKGVGRKRGVLDRVTKWLLPDDRTGLQPPHVAATTAALFAPATSIIHRFYPNTLPNTNPKPNITPNLSKI